MEVIAVSVIVAVLAAVAIPVYLGYITDQRRQAAAMLAKTGAVAGNVYWRRNGADPPDAAALHLFLPGPQYRVDIRDGSIVVTEGTAPDTVEAAAAFR